MSEDGNVNSAGAVLNGITSAIPVRRLQEPEVVRLRPAMYVGSTDVHGLHQLVYNLVSIGVHEFLNAFADKIDVVIQPDDTIIIIDNGHGLPVEWQSAEQKSLLELLMTNFAVSDRFNSGEYKLFWWGNYCKGAVVVNSLSTWMRVENCRNGRVYTQDYAKGVPTSPVHLADSDPTAQGTVIYFKADSEIFETTDYQYSILAEWFRELCYLLHGLKIRFADERAGQEAETLFHFEDGISALVRDLNRDQAALHPLFYVADTIEKTVVEVALQYTTRPTELVLTFVNAWKMVDGGTPVAGFYAALTRTLKNYARKNSILSPDIDRLRAADVRHGLTAVINVRVINPHYNSSMHNNLSNPEVQGHVQQVVGRALTQFLYKSPEDARKIIAHCVAAAQTRKVRCDARRVALTRQAQHRARRGRRVTLLLP